MFLKYNNIYKYILLNLAKLGFIFKIYLILKSFFSQNLHIFSLKIANFLAPALRIILILTLIFLINM